MLPVKSHQNLSKVSWTLKLNEMNGLTEVPSIKFHHMSQDEALKINRTNSN